MNKNLEGFLRELANLSDKYGIEIGGCGCCGSPWLGGIGESVFEKEKLEYDKEKKIYTVE